MKKQFILLVILSFAFSTIYASLEMDKIETSLKINGISSQSILVVNEYASFLDEEEKEDIYSTYSQSAFFPSLLNFFLGFGIGSFSSGDFSFGTTQFFLDLSSFGFIYMAGFTDILNNYPITQYTLLLTSIGSLIISKVYGVMVPIIKTGKKNVQLNRALYYSNVKLSIIPTSLNQVGIIATIRI